MFAPTRSCRRDVGMGVGVPLRLRVGALRFFGGHTVRHPGATARSAPVLFVLRACSHLRVSVCFPVFPGRGEYVRWYWFMGKQLQQNAKNPRQAASIQTRPGDDCNAGANNDTLQEKKKSLQGPKSKKLQTRKSAASLVHRPEIANRGSIHIFRFLLASALCTLQKAKRQQDGAVNRRQWRTRNGVSLSRRLSIKRPAGKNCRKTG